MSGKPYLRPTGLIWGDAAAEARAQGAALPIAGGPLACLGFEIIEGTPGGAAARFASARDLNASDEPEIAASIEKLTAPRVDIAGVSLGETRIMGIVNVTPDSFSDGGEFQDAEAAAAQGRRLASEGAAFIDIGGESTRPGSSEVGEEEELRRIGPVLDRLRTLSSPISVDTRKAGVMRAAAAQGAAIINDVSALTHDAEALATAAALQRPVILMHAKGDPRTMQENPTYADVLLEVYDFLEARIAVAEAAALPRRLLIADPGIGFGKTIDHNLALLAGLSLFHTLGVPLLVGASRKRFIGTVTGETDPRRRAAGSIGVALAAAGQGVQILRVHDVRDTRQALDVWRAARAGRWHE